VPAHPPVGHAETSPLSSGCTGRFLVAAADWSRPVAVIDQERNYCLPNWLLQTSHSGSAVWGAYTGSYWPSFQQL